LSGPAAHREAALARTLLVEACEECDPEARFVPRREREAATREARAAHPGDAAAFVAERARRLAGILEARSPVLRAARRIARPLPPALPVLILAALAGLGADALGAGRRVNLLAFPLLALIAWNFSVYAALAFAPLFARRVPRLGRALARASLWLAERRVRLAAPDEARWLAASLDRFAREWSRVAGPLLAMRARRLLHVGSLGFAAGIIAGMYVRGLVFDYRASWESTFLDAPEVAQFLGFVLRPAAILLDALSGAPRTQPLLSAESLAALRAPEGAGTAAPWIHLWATTAAFAIVLPRAALALAAALRERRLAAGLAAPLEEPYFLRLLAADRGEGVRVAVLPYSHRLSPKAADSLLELLHELFGSRAQLALGEPLPYGSDPPPEALGEAARVAVFNLAQPPEHEVHGAFLEALALGGRAPLLVVLDEEGYRARLGADGSERLAQRRRAWERTAREAGLEVASLQPESGASALAAARAALRPGGGAPAR
jgi:hypothetical protein